MFVNGRLTEGLLPVEPVGVEVVFRNPLKVPLNLSNLSLLWKFIPDGEEKEESFSNVVCLHVSTNWYLSFSITLAALFLVFSSFICVI